jgi:hypothetical protein
MKKRKLISVLFLVFGIAALFATSYYTKVNATSTTLLLLFIMGPCTIINAILCVVVFSSENKTKALIVQAVVFSILLFWFIDYVFIE